MVVVVVVGEAVVVGEELVGMRDQQKVITYLVKKIKKRLCCMHDDRYGCINYTKK